jgi:glycerol-3-phosphate acyltransferase PlsX
VEVRDVLSADYDVLVCDGFVANVLTKTVEGTAKMVTSMLKKEIKASKSAMVGALFMKKALGNLKESMNYQAFGGAAFLGIEKVLVKSHGSSNALAITASINTVIRTSKCDLVKNIQAAITAQKATE